MANRCLLHQKKLEAFKEWLVTDGWEIHPCKSIDEVLRAKKDRKWIIVFRKFDATVHCTVRYEDVPIVRRFLKAMKNGARRIEDADQENA